MVFVIAPCGKKSSRKSVITSLISPTIKRLNRAHTVINTRWGRLNRDNNRQSETPKFPSHSGEKRSA